MSRLPPPYYHRHPSLNRRPSPGSRREWVCERGGALKQPGLAACDEGMRHTWSEWSLITADVKCRVRLSSRDRSLSRACTLVSSWVQEGSVEGIPHRQSRELPDTLYGWQDRPGCRAVYPPEHRGPGGRSRQRKPPRPGPGGSACGRRTPPLPRTPSFLNTAPPSRTPQHGEDTRSPVCFGHYFPLWTLYFDYFCWIKASPRPEATPIVSIVCSSRHT